MPKVRSLDPLEEKRDVVASILAGRMRYRHKENRDIATKLKCSERTVVRRMKRPEDLTLGDIWAMSDYIGLTDHDLLQIAKGRLI